MPKKTHKTKNDRGAHVKFFVNGIDDASTGTERPLHNIEAGSWIHGFVVIFDLPFVGETLLAKFSIEGEHKIRHEHTQYRTDSEGNEYPYVESKSKEKKWLKNKDKLALRLSGYTSDTPGKHTLTFPFSFFVSGTWCDSFHGSYVSCDYKLKLKTKFVDTDFKFSVKRKIDIMRRRPTSQEMCKKVPVDVDSHSSLWGGQAKAVITLNSSVFVEGTQVQFTAHISNMMDKPIMNGKLELEEEQTLTVLRTNERSDHESWSTSSSRRDLLNVSYRSMEIPPQSECTLVFSLDLPPIVEPPTTGFKHKHHHCKVHHFLKLQLDIPWGRDIRTEFPVTIVPNPSRYAIVPPHEFPVRAVADCSFVRYTAIPVEPPMPPPMFDASLFAFEFILERGIKLPKMDFTFGGMRGGADPYVTMFLSVDNKENSAQTAFHIRSSKIVHNTQDPVFNQKFVFLLQGPIQIGSVINVKFNCYDYDSGSHDDKIGNGELIIEDLNDINPSSIQVPLTLSHKKKGELERGSLVVKCAFHKLF